MWLPAPATSRSSWRAEWRPGGEVIGSDFSELMLARARAKAQSAGSGELRFESGDALALPYEDDRFDVATVGFGARNFADLARGLAEMARVVRPGGRVVVLEITAPAGARSRSSTRCGLTVWCRRSAGSRARPWAACAHCAARRAARASRTPTPTCPSRSSASRRLRCSRRRWSGRDCAEISYVLMAGGIVAIHVGTVQRIQARNGAATISRGD